MIRRQSSEIGLSSHNIDQLLDSICTLAHHQQIYFAWRPTLPDANDDHILEIAVAAQCPLIVTHNTKDFKGSEKFNVNAITPKEFLQTIGEVKK